MFTLLEIFTTRELALFIWIIILLFIVLFLPQWRYHAKAIAKASAHPILLILDATLLIYVLAITLFLWIVGFWEMPLLKDTIIWFLFSAVGLFHNIHTVKNAQYFRQLLKSSVTVSVFVEFITNLYPFGLITELIALPVIVFLTFVSVYAKYHAETDKNQKNVYGCLKTLSTIAGLLYFGYAIYRTIVEYRDVFTVDILKQFLLPICLIILFIPYLYGLALYSKFETMFCANKIMFRDRSKADRLKIKLFVLYYWRFSFKNLYRIWKHLGILAYKEDADYGKYIKRVASAPEYKRHSITKKMTIGLFDSIDACCKTLSGLGIGEFGEWENPDGFEEYYCSNGYYKIKPDWLSNLLLTLQGEERHIHQIELVLSVYNQMERELSLQKFKDCTNSIIQYLSLYVPDKICDYGNFKYNNSSYSIEITKEINGILEQFILTIKSAVKS